MVNNMTVKDLNLINLKLKQLIQASKQKDISNQPTSWHC